MSNIGSTIVKKGQLITLMVESKNELKSPFYHMLLVKEDFSLSEEIASFYKHSEDRAVSSDIVTKRFYLTLVKKGLVEKPENMLFNMGKEGRPSKRFSDEYRFSINPSDFYKNRLIELMDYNCLIFKNHQNVRCFITGVPNGGSIVSFELRYKDIFNLGQMDLEVTHDRYSDFVLNEEDIKKLTIELQNKINEAWQEELNEVGSFIINKLEFIKTGKNR